MASEPIGGVSITVDADFSNLDSQFQAAVQQAQQDSQAISAAIESGIKGPDLSGFNDSLAGAVDQAKGLAQGIADAFANVSIELPTGSIVSGSAAADIAKEIAQAFASQPVSLNIDTETAGSAAS